jgi:ATP-dependent Clp protease ATP-binding subunit ClpC
MFERFTDRARRVVVFAQDEARGLNHNWIGTEHLLLGLIREGDGVAAQVLVNLGSDLNRARQQVIQLLHGHQGRRTAIATIGEELGDRLASMAARLAVIERRLGDTTAEG